MKKENILLSTFISASSDSATITSVIIEILKEYHAFCFNILQALKDNKVYVQLVTKGGNSKLSGGVSINKAVETNEGSKAYLLQVNTASLTNAEKLQCDIVITLLILLGNIEGLKITSRNGSYFNATFNQLANANGIELVKTDKNGYRELKYNVVRPQVIELLSKMNKFNSMQVASDSEKPKIKTTYIIKCNKCDFNDKVSAKVSKYLKQGTCNCGGTLKVTQKKDTK